MSQKSSFTRPGSAQPLPAAGVSLGSCQTVLAQTGEGSRSLFGAGRGCQRVLAPGNQPGAPHGLISSFA